MNQQHSFLCEDDDEKEDGINIYSCVKMMMKKKMESTFIPLWRWWWKRRWIDNEDKDWNDDKDKETDEDKLIKDEECLLSQGAPR